MIDFARIDGTGDPYPTKPVDSTDGQSSDFITPFKINSGTQRGIQGVGFTGPVIDNAHNRITITNPADKTSIGMGIIPGTTTNEFGFFSLDSNGNVVMKIVNGTRYVYDLNTNKNIMQDGKLPDGTYGWFVAAPGQNVADAIST
jgi:hypothetical protein